MCVSVNICHYVWVPLETREGVRAPGIGVREACELLDVDAGH